MPYVHSTYRTTVINASNWFHSAQFYLPNSPNKKHGMNETKRPANVWVAQWSGRIWYCVYGLLRFISRIVPGTAIGKFESNTWLHRCEHGRKKNKSNKIVRIIKMSCGLRTSASLGYAGHLGTKKKKKVGHENNERIFEKPNMPESEIGQIKFEFINSVWWTAAFRTCISTN